VGVKEHLVISEGGRSSGDKGRGFLCKFLLSMCC